MTHAGTTMNDTLMVICNEESTYLLDFRTAHVKGGSESSNLFIIKATFISCAYFGWGIQVCITAIGTRDVSSIKVIKYAFDLERSSVSTSTKTETQQLRHSYPSLGRAAALGSGMHNSNIYSKAIQLWKRLSPLLEGTKSQQKVFSLSWCESYFI